MQQWLEKRHDARAKWLFWQPNPIAFLPVLLLSLHVCLDPWLPWQQKSLEFEADPASNNVALKSREHLTLL